MFKFNRSSGIGAAVTANAQQGVASMRRHSKVATAADALVPGSGTPNVPSYNANRYNPVWDRLEQGAVYEDWVPRNNSGINMMYRRIYARDAICGPAVDLWCNIPWSSFDIVGIKDPSIRKFYEDAFGWWDMDLLGQVSREYLMLGRFAASLQYDDARGYWTNLIAHDPDFLEITPIPVRGFDPKLDLLLSPGVRRWLSSEDERDVRAKLTLSTNLLEKLLTLGKIPLEQFNTLYLARKCSPYDYIGTSLLTRVVPFWAIEKALTDAMTVAARRRAGNILHVQAGIDGLWEPTPDEINMISGLFLQADEDPTGAIVVTRNGLQVQEVRQGGQIWKLSDEFEFLTQGKMRALGINSAFLDGEACVVGNTLIPTENGILRIGDIFNKDEGNKRDFTLTVASRYGSVKASKWYYNGIKETKIIKTQPGHEIQATLTHPLLVFNGVSPEWKRTSELKVGDVLCVSTKPQLRTTKEKLILNLSPPEKDFFHGGKKKEIKKPEYMSVPLARLLGLLVAEGSITYTEEKACYQVRFTNSDTKVMEVYCSLMEDIFGVETPVRVMSTPEKTYKTSFKPTKVCYEAIMLSKTLVQWFKQLGLEVGKTREGKTPSYFKHIPWCVLQGDEQTQLSYIAAYLEGDGSATTSNLAFSSRSIDMLKELQILLAAHGYSSYITGYALELTDYDSRKIWKHIKPYMITKTFKGMNLLSSTRVNQALTFSSEPWKNILKERKVGRGTKKGTPFKDDTGKIVFIKGWRNYCSYNKTFSPDGFETGLYNKSNFMENLKIISKNWYDKLITLFDNSYKFVKISSIEDGGIQPVFDLSMGPNEEPAFIANGVVNHNSYNNVEAAKSVFVEQIINFRHTLTHQIFTRKAEILARAHGFRQLSQAQLDHRIRVKEPELQVTPEELRRRLKIKNLSFEESFKIPVDELILPTVHWHKELKPNQDEKFVDMLEKMEDHLGFKLPLRIWTASTGVSLDDLVAMIPEDKQLREKISKLVGTEEGAGAEGGEGAPGGGGEENPFPEASVKLSALPVWKEDAFLGLKKTEAQACMDKLLDHKDEIKKDGRVLKEIIADSFGTNAEKRDNMNYLLMRIGVSRKLPVSDNGLKAIANNICNSTLNFAQIAQELNVLSSLASSDSKVVVPEERYTETYDKMAKKIISSVKNRGDDAAKNLTDSLRREKEMPNTSPNLIGGVIN